MRTISLMGLILAAPCTAAPPATQPHHDVRADRQCLNQRVSFADHQVRAGVRKLSELPAGNLSLTVAREIDGCQTATIIRYGNGSSLREPPQRERPAEGR